MFEKVTVTDAMAEDMEKLRPRLKNVHMRELVVAITIMPKMRKATFTCRRKCRCSPLPAHRGARSAAAGSHHSLGGRASELSCTGLHLILCSAHLFTAEIN